jgi:catechol 2,3-dioxygenase-like lactoylglutathione lyase family enzyme
LDVAVPEFEENVNFYKDAWGLSLVEKDGDLAFLACEGSPEQFTLRIRKAPEKRVDLIGLGTGSAADVDEIAGRLASDGVRFVSEPGKLQTPGGGYGFRVFDPDGRVLEISSDVEQRQARVIEERESIPVKVSHIVVGSANPEETVAFYREKLGFKISDYIGEIMTFMRCTTDHHSIAVFRAEAPELNHIAYEMRGIDEYMRATGRVMKTGAVMRWGPGRHLVGDNTFSYYIDPAGNTSEFTTAMEQFPLGEGGREPQRISTSAGGDEWGTAAFAPQDIVPANAKVRDTGYGTAPPV